MNFIILYKNVDVDHDSKHPVKLKVTILDLPLR